MQTFFLATFGVTLLKNSSGRQSDNIDVRGFADSSFQNLCPKDYKHMKVVDSLKIFAPIPFQSQVRIVSMIHILWQDV